MEKMNGNKTNGDKVNGIKVINKNRVIEITKKFEKAASYYGTDEYNVLQAIRRDYPEYRVMVKKTAKKTKDTCKGLTYRYMELYIKNHDDNEGSIMEMYRNRREKGDEVEEKPYTYAQMKKWFLETYPGMAEFSKNKSKVFENTTNNVAA